MYWNKQQSFTILFRMSFGAIPSGVWEAAVRSIPLGQKNFLASLVVAFQFPSKPAVFPNKNVEYKVLRQSLTRTPLCKLIWAVAKEAQI